MKEIDEVIEKHGGWPGAFVTTPMAGNSPAPKAPANENEAEAEEEPSKPTKEEDPQLPFA